MQGKIKNLKKISYCPSLNIERRSRIIHSYDDPPQALSLDIRKIEFGSHEQRQVHVGVIECAPHTSPGELYAWAQQLNTHYPAIHAIPGTRRQGEVPVLRLSILTDKGADHARGLFAGILRRESAVLHPDCDMPELTPLGREQMPDMAQHLKQGLQEMAGPAAGYSWQTANALQAWQAYKTQDYGKLGLSGSYFLANLVTMFYTGGAQGDAVEQVIRETEDALVEKNIISPGALQENAEGLKGTAQQVDRFLRRHPWEMAGLMQAGGALTYLGMALFGKERSLPRTVGATAAVTATALQTLLPQENGQSLLSSFNNHEKKEDRPGQFILRPLGQAFAPIGALSDTFAETLSPVRHKVIAGLHTVNNVGILVSTLTDEHQQHKKEQIAASMLTFLGYGLQASVKDPAPVQLEEGDRAFVLAAYLNRQYGDPRLGPDTLARHVAAIMDSSPHEKDREKEMPEEQAAFVRELLGNLEVMQNSPAASVL